MSNVGPGRKGARLPNVRIPLRKDTCTDYNCRISLGGILRYYNLMTWGASWHWVHDTIHFIIASFSSSDPMTTLPMSESYARMEESDVLREGCEHALFS
jgi:hypothetical protein